MLAAISLFAPGLMGLGLLALLALPDFWSASRLDPPARATALAAALALGLDLYYLLALALCRPAAVIPIAAGLAAAGWIAAMLLLRRDLRTVFALGAGPYLLLGALFLLASSHVLLRPLEAGDARSIWFHQARLIYYFGDLRTIGEFGVEAGRISQPYYPKLLALLAASAAQLAGFWNEYFPKAALLALLLPPAVAALAFWRERITFLFLLLAFFIVPHEFMWDGMVDGYLALYAGFAMLHLGRWLESRSPTDLVLALAFFGVACGLKSEANLLLVALAATGILLALRAQSGLHRALGPVPPALAVPAVAAFAGFLLWHVLRIAWHLDSELTFGPEAWQRMIARLQDPQAITLIGQLYLLSWRALTCFIFAGGAIWLFRRGRIGMPPGVPLALGTALLYFGGILLVYLMTPHGLFYHLVTSADRVLMTPRALVFAAAALWMHAHERALRTRVAA